MGTRCPECRSDDVIEWDDGFICRDCGCEFDERKQPEDEQFDEVIED